jgi:microcompartment protein CcmL/EutN
LVTVVVEGTVSAVEAAAEAGKAAAAQVGPVKLCEVIARPHPQIMKFLYTDPQ